MSRILIVILFCANSCIAAEFTINHYPFDHVNIYRPAGEFTNVVLFVSGDEGWKMGVIDMARALTKKRALVIGIDIVRYLQAVDHSNAGCLFPAGDFEDLSKSVQQQLNVKEYMPPILIGYSSGATLVYTILAQASPAAFRGAISLGFCPDLETINPLCKGAGLESRSMQTKYSDFYYYPATYLRTQWYVLHGTADSICGFQASEAYVEQVPSAKFVELRRVGHGFSRPKNWMTQFMEAFRSVSAGEDVAIH